MNVWIATCEGMATVEYFDEFSTALESFRITYSKVGRISHHNGKVTLTIPGQDEREIGTITNMAGVIKTKPDHF